MKKVMILMNVLMGLTMSFILSLVGSLTGGNFQVPMWLMSFGVSFVISLIIGFLVPIKKLGDGACEKFKVPAQSFKGTLISALISDLIYTPIITVIMVLMIFFIVTSNHPEANLPLVPMMLSSLGICLVAGYIAIVIVQPLLLRALMKNVRKNGGPEGRPQK